MNIFLELLIFILLSVVLAIAIGTFLSMTGCDDD